VKHGLTKLLFVLVSCNTELQPSSHDRKTTPVAANKYEETAKTQPQPVCVSHEIRNAVNCANFPHTTTLGSALVPHAD
jgi:hypothetical protein